MRTYILLLLQLSALVLALEECPSETFIQSSGCKTGPGDHAVDFDLKQFSGTWYWTEHSENNAESNVGCPSDLYGSPGNEKSLVTTIINKADSSKIKEEGEVSTWNSDCYHTKYINHIIYDASWYVLGLDFQKYAVFRACLDQNSEPTVLVGYRTLTPDEDTKKKAEEIASKFGYTKDVLKPYEPCN